MITMLINPFMSSSARLPVYLLFAGAFFKEHAGLVLFGLYFTGIFLAVVSARLFKQFLFKGEDSPFVMELPPYRIPTAKSVGIHMWQKSQQYLRKMGGIILTASIIVWFLGYFPLQKKQNTVYDRQISKVEQAYKQKTISGEEKEIQTAEINKERKKYHQANSFIGTIGQFIEPVMKPLGFDWKISVSLLSAMPAKEIAVSTLSVLYTGEENAESSLQDRLLNDVQADGSKTFTPVTVIALLLFVLIYFPCIATIIAIKEESGSWKWGLFSIFYSTTLAWIVAFSAYQIGKLFF